MTKMGCKRTEPRQPIRRQPLAAQNRIKSPSSEGTVSSRKIREVVRKSPPRRTPLKTQSQKARLETAQWVMVKAQRIAQLRSKFGVVICERCQQAIATWRENGDAHHNDWNRRHNTLDNCRIVHRLCHTYIHDHNIKDVPSRLDTP